MIFTARCTAFLKPPNLSVQPFLISSSHTLHVTPGFQDPTHIPYSSSLLLACSVYFQPYLHAPIFQY